VVKENPTNKSSRHGSKCIIVFKFIASIVILIAMNRKLFCV